MSLKLVECHTHSVSKIAKKMKTSENSETQKISVLCHVDIVSCRLLVPVCDW